MGGRVCVCVGYVCVHVNSHSLCHMYILSYLSRSGPIWSDAWKCPTHNVAIKIED